MAVLFDESVAVHVTVVVPIGKQDGASLVTITFPEPPTTTGNGGPTTNTAIAEAGLLLKRIG